MRKVLLALAVLVAISPAAFAVERSTTFTISITIPEKPIEFRTAQNAQTISTVRNGQAVSLNTMTVK